MVGQVAGALRGRYPDNGAGGSPPLGGKAAKERAVVSSQPSCAVAREGPATNTAWGPRAGNVKVDLPQLSVSYILLLEIVILQPDFL